MTAQKAERLWIVEMPSDELEQDLDAWQQAEKAIDSLASTFIGLRGVYVDAVFVALTDTKARIRTHVQHLEEEAGRRAARKRMAEEDWARAHYDARSAQEEWEHTLDALEPMLRIARELANPALTGVMVNALEEAREAEAWARERLYQLERERREAEQRSEGGPPPAPTDEPENGGEAASA